MGRHIFGRRGGQIASVAIFCLSGLASVHAGEFTQAQQDACTPDAFRLCSSEIPDVPRITACMEARKAQLSPGCRAVFEADVSPPERIKRHAAHVGKAHYDDERQYYSNQDDSAR